MTTLKEAQKSDNLEQFIKEHEKDPKGNDDQLKDTVKNLARDIRTDFHERVPRGNPRKPKA